MFSPPDQLTVADFLSPTWRKLEAYINTRIADLRERNDQDADAEATAKLRGRIGAFKELLALDITKPGNVTPTTPDDGAAGM